MAERLGQFDAVGGQDTINTTCHAEIPGATPDTAGNELIPENLIVRVADRLRILGQPVRLRLVELLTNGPSTPQELSDALGLSQQNVSKHLLSLHRAGIVSRRPDAPNVFYALTDLSAVTTLQLTLDAVSSHLQDLADIASGAYGGNRPQNVWNQQADHRAE